MRVTRFCSKKEYDAFIAGERLVNNTDHYRGGKGGSLSQGFCFSPDKPKVAFEYLKGTIDTEVCMVLDFPDDYLIESRGKYRNPGVPEDSPMVKVMLKKEFCCGVYDNKVAKLISMTTMYHKLCPNVSELRALFGLNYV